jgi:hypothetical protein
MNIATISSSPLRTKPVTIRGENTGSTKNTAINRGITSSTGR